MNQAEALALTLKTLDKVLDIKPATRLDWQRSLENNLSMFNSDAYECSELLCALIGALENRYDEGQLSDVNRQFDKLMEALQELDQTTVGEDNGEDAAYEDHIARMQWDTEHGG